MDQKRHYRLIITCEDRVGIVAAVSSCIAQHGGWITEANQFSDPSTGTFFMRYEIAADSLAFDAETLSTYFTPVAEQFAMHWHITDTSHVHKVGLFVSKESHCLNDLLYRWENGDLACDIPCVISNHDDLRSIAERHGIAFHHVPVDKDPEQKEAAFQEMADLINRYELQTVVLARYMQILPAWLCERYLHQIINIHHSFLPAFSGARPYHQANMRGVKLTGATCHYVTPDLDAGPIIEQDVIRISHHDSLGDTIRLGRDVEKTVLARGLRYHLEDRVLVQGNKTIVFK